MKHKTLRSFINKKKMGQKFEYANSELVIDGRCLRDMYKISGCQFILGGEHDRFASSLKTMINNYTKSGIKCYVVFSGAGVSDMETRKYVLQKIINKTDAIIPGGRYEYCEPIFVKEVCTDVLNELEIKHYTTIYDSKEVLLKLANKLNCPILTNNIEYALYGVSVISFRSVTYNEETQSIACLIYFNNVCKRSYPLTDDLMSVLFTVTDEDSNFYNELLNMFPGRAENYTSSVLYWLKRQSMESALNFFKSRLTQENWQVFIDTVAKFKQLFICSPYLPAIDFFINDHRTKDRKYGLDNISDKSFEYDIGVGRVATPFINLKTIGILSGSWVVYNENREDAMLVATDIAVYAQSLLRNSQEVMVTFIGRKNKVTHVSIIEKIVNIQKESKNIKRKNFPKPIDSFLNFVHEHLPGFNITMLGTIPDDSWILLISLLYYKKKASVDVTNVAYSIILSYVLLGPVSEKVGVIKRSNFSITHGVTREEDGEATEYNDINEISLTQEQCTKAADAVVDLFYVNEKVLKDNFNRDALHTLAEFQYCLQFINYLNKLCGETMKCTVYHKVINCTFMYNIFIALEAETSAEGYIKGILNCSPLYSYFQKILDAYLRCSSLIH